jgi:hypothetical protein
LTLFPVKTFELPSSPPDCKSQLLNIAAIYVYPVHFARGQKSLLKSISKSATFNPAIVRPLGDPTHHGHRRSKIGRRWVALRLAAIRHIDEDGQNPQGEF